jgi:hypothetical protein
MGNLFCAFLLACVALIANHKEEDDAIEYLHHAHAIEVKS